MVINHGTFTLYEPENKKFPEFNILYLKNESGRDWYEIAHQKPKPTDRWFCQVNNGEVVCVDKDPERLWPINCTLLETDVEPKLGWRWDGLNLTPPPV